MNNIKDILYTTYYSIKDRCTNSNNKDWNHYGGRGIKICDDWLKYDYKNKINIGFINFYNWSIENGYLPNSGLSIDRIDVNGNYEPSNCRWVNHKLQCNNRTSNHYLSYKSYNFPISIWSEITKIPPYIISKRVRKGWAIEDTLRTPPGNKRGESYLCWEITPEYIKYHNPDLNRELLNEKYKSLSDDTKEKIRKGNVGKSNYSCRKLSDTQIYQIISLKSKYGYSNKRLAGQFNVSRPTIDNIINGKTYTNIINTIQNETSIAA